MRKRLFSRPKKVYDQHKQTVDNQINAARDVTIYYPTPPAPAHTTPTAEWSYLRFLQYMGIGFGISITASGIALLLRIPLDTWQLIGLFALVLGVSLTCHCQWVLQRAERERKDRELKEWHNSTLDQLESILSGMREDLLRFKDAERDGLSLTKQDLTTWAELLRNIKLIKELIEKKGGKPRYSKFDSHRPPKPPVLRRAVSWLQANISFLLSVILITVTSVAGVTLARPTVKFVAELVEWLPTPVPSITPTAIPTLLSTTTPAVTLTPTLPIATTPTNLSSAATVTPAVTLGPTLAPTATLAQVENPASTPNTPSISDGNSPTATPTPETATLGSLSGKIAYPVLSGDQYDVVVQNLATNDVYRVQRARQPDLNGGGYLLVNKEGGALARIDVNRQDELPITERDEDARPHWAPADNRVVFESFEADKNTTILKLQQNTELQSNPPNLRSPTGGTISGRNAIFLDDGRIAFNACGSWKPETSGSCGIWSVNTDGSSEVQLSDQPRDYPSDNLKSQVLFTSDREGNWDVYITQSAGQVQRLTDDPARDGLATASPNGDLIAFVSDRGGSWAIWVMNVDGTGQRKLFDMDGSFGQGERDWTTEKISWGP